MALTDEELLLQMNILTSKTDSSTNPNMTYKAVAALNKALDPDIFTGNNTKIVNAINLVADMANNVEITTNNLINKINGILLEVDSTIGQEVWNNVQDLMENPTIIEGIKHILEGKQQERILGITSDDIDKILSVAKDEDGRLITKAVSLGELNINAKEVKYENEEHSELNNVEDAINFILAGSNKEQFTIDWSVIENKPEIVDGLVLTDNELQMVSGDNKVSSIEIINNEDIDIIIDNLD